MQTVKGEEGVVSHVKLDGDLPLLDDRIPICAGGEDWHFLAPF